MRHKFTRQARVSGSLKLRAARDHVSVQKALDSLVLGVFAILYEFAVTVLKRVRRA